MEKKSVSSIFVVLLVQIIIHGDNNIIIVQSLKSSQIVVQCGKTGNLEYDAKVQYRDLMLQNLPGFIISQRPYTGYLVSSDFYNPVRMQGLVLCPTNIKEQSCKDCVEKSIPHLKTTCPKNNKAVIWAIISNSIYCMVRYANYDMRQKYEDWVWASKDYADFIAPPEANVNIVELSKVVSDNFNKLVKEATRTPNDHLRRFASANSTYGLSSRRFYMAVQCTPEISINDCIKCLNEAKLVAQEKGINKAKMLCLVLSMNCNLKYDHYSETVY
ncbi:cysteine-rich repeat secretory protein 38-like [Rutidosis leptorrhynchoides]|uniref:cysteine-rich repeat secretory protein 38-like n=1 Tax=Rutidosis leptorrhynchoides TaxID=125765 RepID=UPI003A9A41A7